MQKMKLKNRVMGVYYDTPPWGNREQGQKKELKTGLNCCDSKRKCDFKNFRKESV